MKIYFFQIRIKNIIDKDYFAKIRVEKCAENSILTLNIFERQIHIRVQLDDDL